MPLSVMQKQCQKRTRAQQQKILNALYQSSNSLPKQTNFKKEDLKAFL